ADLILSAPIEFDGVPVGMALTAERPDSVDVQVHGLRGSLSRLTPDQIKARVSLAGASEGEVAIRLVPEQVVVPAGITVVRINPPPVRVGLGLLRSSRSGTGPRRPRA